MKKNQLSSILGVLVILASWLTGNAMGGRASSTRTNSLFSAYKTGVRPMQVLANGQRPFLAAKPFNESYQSPITLNSFFDHKLPKYEKEKDPVVPSDLRDATRSITMIFTDEERVSNWGQGSGWYSGHDGLDYGLKANVIAPANGRIAAGREVSYCQVWIEHDASLPPDNTGDYVTLYTHMRLIGDAPEEERQRPGRDINCGRQWCKGDTVHAGDIIGAAGNEPCGGASKGIHLHFAVASGTLTGSWNPSFLDPFGWWSNRQDPWADRRLGELSSPLTPQSSHWLWGTSVNPGQGNPGYWGNDILAQVDDTDASFHKFGPLARNGFWKPILFNASAGTKPIGTGAWWSLSIPESQRSTKNWAVWGLYIPEGGRYRIQAHIPALPQDVSRSATGKAVYTVRIPLSDGSFAIWNSKPVNQQIANGWIDLCKEDGTTGVNLEQGTVVLIELSDLTENANEAVLFDAMRLKQESSSNPEVKIWRRVGFVIDNTSSLQAEGKIDAIRVAVPPWIDQLEASGESYIYALEAFAENVPPVKATNDATEIKAWIQALTANDNGIDNYDCPEQSLPAIVKLAPTVQGGDILFFTDDLAKNPDTGKTEALATLEGAQAKMHSIILPKTCWFGDPGDPIGWEIYKFLSLASGGTYQSVSTNKTSDALEIVLAEMETDSQIGFYGANTMQAMKNGVIRASGVDTYGIVVDDTISKINFLLNVLEGSFTLSIFRPDGTEVSPTDLGVVFVDSGSAQYYQISNPAVGVWQARVSGTGDFIFSSSAESEIQFAYLGDVRVSPGTIMQVAVHLSGPIESVNVARAHARDESAQTVDF